MTNLVSTKEITYRATLGISKEMKNAVPISTVRLPVLAFLKLSWFFFSNTKIYFRSDVTSGLHIVITATRKGLLVS